MCAQLEQCPAADKLALFYVFTNIFFLRTEGAENWRFPGWGSFLLEIPNFK
jgi:hypothetical protein